MGQKVADIVIGMDVDTATFNQKLSGVSNGLSEVVKKGESDADRMRRLVQEGIARAQGVESASASSVTQQKALADSLNTRMAAASALVSQAHQQVEQYSKRLKEEAVQTRAVGVAQDKAAQSFFRQIEGVKEFDTGLQKLNNIQVQLRQSRDAGNISQGDYLTLLTTTRARVNELTQAENKSQAAKTQFLQRLKAQVTQQKLSNTEMLRYKATQLGVSDAADIYIRKMEGATKSTQAFGLKSAAARRELGVLFGELARGNLGALRGSSITLANRAGWIEQLMSLRGLAIGGVIGGITAAIYGVGKAWYEGSQEAVEFNKQLILTGSYAGKTAGQLQELAKSLSGNGITEHDAAGALAAVIGSGAFKSNQIESVTKAALAMQKATGQAVSETIKNFQRLYQDPTQGSIELNKQLHYLTSSQYEYISSLERRGYKEAAGEAAADAYSKAEQQRSQQVINNLGLIEKTIQKATKRWNQFWDAALNIGRPQTEQYQIEQVNKAINQIYDDRKKSGKPDLFDVGLQKLLSQKKELEFVTKSQQGYVESQAKAKKADDDRTDSLIYQNQMLSKSMSWQQKRASALTELWQKVWLAPNDWSQEQRTRAVAQINADNKPSSKPKKDKAYQDDEATRLLLQYRQKQAQLQGQIDASKLSVNEKLTESEKQYLALEERISLMKGKTLTASDKSILAHRQELELALKANIEKEKEFNRQSAINELKKKSVQLSREYAEEELNTKKKQALTLDTIGMGDKLRTRYEEEFAIKQYYHEKMAQLDRDSAAKGTKGSPEYDEAMKINQDNLDRALASKRGFDAQLDAAQGDWMNGIIRAYQNIAANAGDAAGTAEQAFMSSFNSMSNGLATFVTTGKLNFKSFTASLLSDLAKIMAQMAMMQAVKGIGSAFGFGGEKNALGGVYTSSSLSAYSGQIVERPTYFKFAKGAGLMGEAGPEAILPLTRDSRGRLAVTAVGGRGMAMFAPQYNVNIQNDGSNGQVGPEALKAVYAVGKKAAADFFQQQRRDGGQMSGAR